MTPDWAAMPTAVPFAQFGNPQSLNLYSYVRNNPISLYDPDGHHCWQWFAVICDTAQRFNNLLHGEGFRTDAGVEDRHHENALFLWAHGIDPEGMSGRQMESQRGAIERNEAQKELVEQLKRNPIVDPALVQLAGALGGGFASKAKLEEHFLKHRNEFGGALTEAEYEAQAKSFLNGPKDPGILEKVRGNGDIVRYNPATNEFGVAQTDGTIRTYFKPDPAEHGYATNMDYFNAQ
jgi:hypothetical protein